LQKYYKNFKLTITANWITGMNSYKRNLTEKSAEKASKERIVSKTQTPKQNLPNGLKAKTLKKLCEIQKQPFLG
jgi:response regulator of citrate/malate metabolism